MKETLFACDLSTISPEERPSHIELAKKLFTSKMAVHETSDGYRFDFSAEWLVSVAQYVSLERLCCPFFDFTIQINSAINTISLYLSGVEGVKTFIHAEFDRLLN